MTSIKENFRILLIGLVLLLVLCLVGVLAFNIFTSTDDQQVEQNNTPALAADTTVTTTEPIITPTPVEPTAISTPVVTQPTAQQTATAITLAITPTPQLATSTPTPTAKPGKPAATARPRLVVQTKLGPVINLLQNGDFEAAFEADGVGSGWQAFSNGQAQAFYGRETAPYVQSGQSAQRITLTGATVGNRYAGILQHLDVITSEVYTLTLHGHIRSVLGDITKSNFGYRMQYAVADPAVKSWENVAEEKWLELPWDEQPLNLAPTRFFSYSTTIRPASNTITLFVRAWNKWPDQSEAQYTFDNFSLLGATLVTETVVIAANPITGSQIIPPTPVTGTLHQPLPVTGAEEGAGLWQDGRFWLGVLLLLILAGGATFRARWSY